MRKRVAMTSAPNPVSPTTPSLLDRTPWLRPAIIAILAGVTVSYLLWRTVLSPEPEIDFRYYWAAGKAWATGFDPYSPPFAAFAAAIVPPGNVISFWAYPPHWWPIARMLSLGDIATATTAWRVIGTGLALAGTAAVATVGVPGKQIDRMMAVAAAFALSLVEPTAQAIAYGQSSLVVYSGVCMVAVAHLRRWPALMAFGLAVAALKPQVGILVFCFLAMDWRNWAAIAGAGVIALAAASPQFVQHGFVNTLMEMRGNLPQTNVGAFTMAALTGPVQLLARAGIEVPATIEFVAAAAAAALAGLAATGKTGAALRLPLAVAIAAIGALAPLHTYDLTLLILPPIIAWRCDLMTMSRIAIAAAIAMLIRPSKIEALLGFQLHGSGVSAGAFFSTVAGLIILTATTAALIRARSTERIAPAPPTAV